MSNCKKAVAIFASSTAKNIPNTITIAAIQELENGGGELWKGHTEDLFAILDAEDNP